LLDTRKKAEPRIFLKRLDFNHVLYRKYKAFQGDLLFVLYNHNQLFNISLVAKMVEAFHHDEEYGLLTSTSSSPMALTAPEMYSFKVG